MATAVVTTTMAATTATAAEPAVQSPPARSMPAMPAASTIRLGALFAGLAVALGAFAAHGLKHHLDDYQLTIFETGVRYQMYHGLALLLCGALGTAGWRTGKAAVAFVAGIVLFSGSLYGLALVQWKWLGPVTPVGGVAFLIGWLLLVVARRSGGA